MSLCYQKMLAIFPTRAVFFIGDSLPVKKLSGSRIAGFHTSIWFQSRVDRENGPLTLASLGFRSERDPVTDDPPKKDQNDGIGALSSALRVSPSKAKATRSSGFKVAEVKSALEIESAPFSAKSFSELDLSPLLIERLEKAGLTVPTDVQSTAIPTISQNHDDGDIMPNSPNSFKVYQRRKRRVADQAMMWMDDVYHDFSRQDGINPPLDYHYDDIRRLDFGGSTS